MLRSYLKSSMNFKTGKKKINGFVHFWLVLHAFSSIHLFVSYKSSNLYPPSQALNLTAYVSEKLEAI